jgi:hypothetical protein
MSVSKLLSRIKAPQFDGEQESGERAKGTENTNGILDPMTQFAWYADPSMMLLWTNRMTSSVSFRRWYMTSIIQVLRIASSAKRSMNGPGGTITKASPNNTALTWHFGFWRRISLDIFVAPSIQLWKRRNASADWSLTW